MQAELGQCCESGKFEDAISELDDVDFLTKQTVQKFAETLSMSDEGFIKKQEISKKFRDLLLSLAKG